MPDPISGAIMAGSVVSAGSSYMGQRSASKRAAKAQGAQLDFEARKYADWQATYGPIQDNLANYYGSLTPDYYEVQGLEAFQQEQQLAMQSLEESLAQRGITDSGIAAAADIQMAQEGAVNRAQIRATAPTLAAEEQARFLQIGLGQNPGQGMSQALAQRAQSAQQTAASAQQAFGGALQSAITTGTKAVADYFRPAQQAPLYVPGVSPGFSPGAVMPAGYSIGSPGTAMGIDASAFSPNMAVG